MGNKRMKKSLFLVWILMCLFTKAVEATSTSSAAAFLKNPSEPRGIALGGAYTALVDQSDSMYWNPAGLQESVAQDVQVSVSQAYETQFTQCNAVFFLQRSKSPLKRVPVGVMIKVADMGGIEETEWNETTNRYEKTGKTFQYQGRSIGIGSAVPLSDAVSLGYSLKYIEESAYSEKASSFGADIGLKIKPNSYSSMGVMLRNVIQPKQVWSTDSQVKEPVFREVVVGGSYKLKEIPVTLTSDTLFQDQRSPELRLGCEIRFIERVPVWLGSNNGEISLGTGIMTEKIGVMLSWTQPKNSMLDPIYKFGVRFGI